MKRAIISDIHSNLEALEAVLADIRSQGITEVFCLGDVVGYGPDPCACLDRVMKCDACILGNHDQGALFDPEGFNSGAERAIRKFSPGWIAQGIVVEAGDIAILVGDSSRPPRP